MDAGGGRDDVLLCVFASARDVVDGVELGELDPGVFLDVCVDDDGESFIHARGLWDVWLS